MRVVVDTNVLVSAVISPGGTPARVVSLWRDGQFVLLVNQAILAELSRALAQPRLLRKYALTRSRIERLLNALRESAVVVEGDPVVHADVRDPDDRKFIECALAGAADYLVSGDRDLLSLGEHAGIAIISPAAFLRVMTSQ